MNKDNFNLQINETQIDELQHALTVNGKVFETIKSDAEKKSGMQRVSKIKLSTDNNTVSLDISVRPNIFKPHKDLSQKTFNSLKGKTFIHSKRAG